MDDVFVARIMSTSLYTVTPETLVADAGQLLLENEIGSVLVVEGENTLTGILTSTDFVRIVAESRPKAETAVSRYMSTDVTTATAQTTVREAADIMIAHGVHHLPVTDDDGGLIGMVTTTDLAAYLATTEQPIAG